MFACATRRRRRILRAEFCFMFDNVGQLVYNEDMVEKGGVSSMTEHIKLPVGVDSFEKIRREGFYYVDKTLLIEQLLEECGEVNLFTRPRRFGKTLNMTMLRSFFEIGTDETLFDGLAIQKNRKLCEEYLGKYPVVFLSLKSVDGLTFDSAKYRLMELIGMEAERFFFFTYQ